MQGLAPEEIALMEKKRRRYERKQTEVKNVTVDKCTSDTSSVVEEFDSIEDEEEETELIFASYYRDIKEYVCNLVKAYLLRSEKEMMIEDQQETKIDEAF